MWRSKTRLGLELKDDVLKIVELSRHGRGVRLERFVYERLPDGWVSGGILKEPALLGDFIQDVFIREAFQTRKVHLSIDTPHFTLRRKKYPYMKKKDLRRAIAFEIAEQMELPFDDPWYEAICLQKPDKHNGIDEWEVLLVVTSEAFIHTYVAFMRDCRLKPLGVDLAPLAIDRWLKYVRPKDEGAASMLVANLSSYQANVSVFEEYVLTGAYHIRLPMSAVGTEDKPHREHDPVLEQKLDERDLQCYVAPLIDQLKQCGPLQEDKQNTELILTGEGVPLLQVRNVLHNELAMRVTVPSGEIPINETLVYRSLRHFKPGLCLPMGLALKGWVHT